MGPHFGLGTGPIILDNVICGPNDATLLDCSYANLTDPEDSRIYTCRGGGGAGVKCHDHHITNVSITIVDSPHSFMYYAIISWGLQNNTTYQPSSYNVLCFNEELQHTVHLVLSNITFSTQLGGLLPSTTYYICCISASIGNNDVLDEICIQTQVRQPNETIIGNTPTETLKFIRETPISSHPMDNRASIVGGVLGFVIVILLIALAICGSVLLFLLRSRSSLLLKR